MGALEPDVLTWVWLVPAAVGAVVAVVVPRGRLAAAAVTLAALTAWLVGLSGGTVLVQTVVAVAIATVVGAVAARYQELIRRGSGLPPGIGGGRLVGMTGTITHHDGAGDARVSLDGDEWRVAGDTDRLAEGDRVRVTGVEGVALVVTPAPAAAPDENGDHPPRSQTQDGVT